MGTRTTKVVRRDQWDEADWEETSAAVVRVEATALDMAAVHPAAPDVLGDLFASVFKVYPEIEDDDRIEPSHTINRAVMAEWLDSGDYPALHQLCRGDRVQAAMTAVSVAEQVAATYQRVSAETDSETSRLQDALDALEQATNNDGDVADAEREVAEAQEALDDAVESQLAGVSRDVRRAATNAREDAEGQAAAMTAWGKGPGERSRMDPGAYLDLAARLNNPRFQRITQLLGAMRSLSWGARQTKYNRVPEELHDVTIGDDLAHVLPSELLDLAVPEMEDLFYLRLLAGELMVYELRGVEREGRGAIVFCEDSSGSMSGPKELWAKALGLALLVVAKEEGRAATMIQFGGAGKVVVFEFPDPASHTTEALLDYASSHLADSGTCFQTGLGAALSHLEAEHELTGRVRADVVFATDGQDSPAAAWIEQYRSTMQRLQAKTYGIAIGVSGRSPALTQLCDAVADVRDLATGNDVQGVFQNVA